MSRFVNPQVLLDRSLFLFVIINICNRFVFFTLSKGSSQLNSRGSSTVDNYSIDVGSSLINGEYRAYGEACSPYNDYCQTQIDKRHGSGNIRIQ